jgi:hypothetical protein
MKYSKFNNKKDKQDFKDLQNDIKKVLKTSFPVKLTSLYYSLDSNTYTKTVSIYLTQKASDKIKDCAKDLKDAGFKVKVSDYSLLVSFK